MAFSPPFTLFSTPAQAEALKLLKVLESLELSGVLRLLEHTNADFVVRLFNGPLDSVVATMAGSVAEALVDRQIAGLVKHGTDTIQERQTARFRVVLEAFGYFFGGFGAISHGF